jgi:ribosomal protein S18 acetylase RimI-like enzyme
MLGSYAIEKRHNNQVLLVLRMLISYRELREEDIQQVQEVALKAWEFTYRNIYAPSTIIRQVAEYYATERLKASIERAERKESHFEVVLDNGKPVGYTNVGRARGTWRNPFLPKGKVYRTSGWELFRIYLRPEYIGKGIGKELLHRCEEFLRGEKAKQYTVYVHVRNQIGKKFYLRNGFARAKELDRGPTSPCFVKTL